MSQSKRICRVIAVTGICATGLWGVLSAHAELGGAPVSFSNAVSVASIRPSLTASALLTSGVAAAPAYSVRQTTLNNGTVVREYIAPNGQVFGAAWQGPVQPDLGQVLGAAHLATFASGVAAIHAVRGSRAPVSIDQPDLVVHVGGHMRAYVGQAWLPQALPAGVSGDDIR